MHSAGVNASYPKNQSKLLFYLKFVDIRKGNDIYGKNLMHIILSPWLLKGNSTGTTKETSDNVCPTEQIFRKAKEI